MRKIAKELAMAEREENLFLPRIHLLVNICAAIVYGCFSRVKFTYYYGLWKRFFVHTASGYGTHVNTDKMLCTSFAKLYSH